MEMVVVLPAPFGPRKPKISPRRTWKLTPSTATVLAAFGFEAAYTILNSRASMTTSGLDDVPGDRALPGGNADAWLKPHDPR